MKKKILFMVQVPPPVHGAALRNLSLYQSKLLHESFDIKLLPLAFADDIASIGKLSARKILKTFQYTVKLIGALISFRPRIAYFTLTPSGGAFYRDCLFVTILKLSNRKIVYHLRGLGVGKAKDKNRFNQMLYQFVFKNAYVICLSQNQLQDIKGLKYKKHFVVPNGIKREAGAAWQNIGSAQKMRLLFLSNFIKSKGVYEFLDALIRLKKANVEFTATMVGADYNITRADIQKYIDENGLQNDVTVRGATFNAEKYQLISDCDIFVLPTYFELFPGVVLEAMQCGKPVVSTFTGAIPEIIDDSINGLLVETRNVCQLAEKIKYLIQHREEAKIMGKKAGEKFNRLYTLEKFEENMRTVFTEI